MAGHIGGEGNGEVGHDTYFFKVAVDVVFHLFVLQAFCSVLYGDDGEKVGAVCGMTGVFVNNGLHGGFPSDGECLSGFPAAVLQQAVADVGLPEIGHVDEYMPCR